MNFSIFEVLMLICFAVSWPISIVKALKTKIVIGKSPIFMSLIIIGYVFGIIHKLLYDPDMVTWLWAFNMCLVSFDLILYFCYIGENRRKIARR